MEIRNRDITNLGIIQSLDERQDSNIFFLVSALLHTALITAGSKNEYVQ